MSRHSHELGFRPSRFGVVCQLVTLSLLVSVLCLSACGDVASASLRRTQIVSAWSSASLIAGTAESGINPSVISAVTGVSCPVAGDCSAVGYYSDAAGNDQAFVVDEHDGIWGKAIEIPQTGQLTTFGAYLSSISCPTPGNCSAVGGYLPSAWMESEDSGTTDPFAIDEVDGVWGNPQAITGDNIYGVTSITSVSCSSPGNCSSSGDSWSGHEEFDQRLFVVDEKNGVWGSIEWILGAYDGLSDVPDGANITSLSCPTSGNCSAGGFSLDDTLGQSHAFLLSEVNGVWSDATSVPNLDPLNLGGSAKLAALACSAAGECIAGGSYTGLNGDVEAFSVRETAGSWGDAVELPGLSELNADDNATVESISCARGGDCSVGGNYTDAQGYVQSFIGNETDGIFSDVQEVPGTATLNVGDVTSSANSVYTFPIGLSNISCATSDDCTAIGTYEDASKANQSYVLSERNGKWGDAVEIPSAGYEGVGAAPNVEGSNASVLSCASAVDCVIGGSFVHAKPTRLEEFVFEEKNGLWGSARPVRGIIAMSEETITEISQISCTSAVDCTATGYQGTASDGSQPQTLVVEEVDGVWGSPHSISGLASSREADEITSLSCPSAGNCTAVGYGSYVGDPAGTWGFVLDETNGVWGSPEGIYGLTLSSDRVIVSCASAGDCSAGGSYSDTNNHTQAFVMSEASGSWGSNIEVPGTAALNVGGDAQITALSCASDGDCSAGGSYSDASGHAQAFVVNEISGVWQSATEVPGTAALNVGGNAQLSTISCASAGDCSAGGSYTDATGHTQTFVVNEASNIWQSAIEVPGTSALNVGGDARISSISCASAGDCSAGGSYSDATGHAQAFVVNETSGVWQNAIEVPGTAALNVGGNAQITTLSCASPGNCSAGGSYSDADSVSIPFVVNENNATWSAATGFPGASDNVTNLWGYAAQVNSVSCVHDGTCTAAGSYGSAGLQGFVTVYTPSAPLLWPQPTPSITGTPRVGDVLNVTPGDWPAGVSLAYRWLRNGTVISGATGASYTVTAADLGTTLSVAVTASLAGFASSIQTSAATSSVMPGTLTPTPVPHISGVLAVGHKLTAIPGDWPHGVALTYQWLRNGSRIPNATSPSYVLAPADLGTGLSVSVSASLFGYSSVTQTSAPTKAIALGTLTSAPLPKISGAARAGTTVNAVTGPWQQGVTFTFQWLQNGLSIPGATKSRLSLATTMVGKRIAIRVVGRLKGYESATRVSAPVVVSKS